MKNTVTRVLVPLIILVLGGAGARAILGMKAKAARKPAGSIVSTVKVVVATSSEKPAIAVANGMVSPAMDVTVQPEVTGRIVYRAESLVPGGRFKKGEVLARIDAREYKLIIRQEESRVRRAELELELEAGRQKIAKREWALLGEGKPGEAAPLALRKPHLAAAKWSLDAAKSGLERAQLNLERTVLRAPFNAVVIDEKLEVGQVVGPNTAAVRLVGTDRLWVKVSLPVERLSVIDVPGTNVEAAGAGSQATIVQALGAGVSVTRQGSVLRVQGELDHQTRTAQLLLVVDAPFENDAGGLPLLPGAYVTVRIQGRSFGGIFAIPREAVHDGSRVWIVDAGGKLARREVLTRWGSAGKAYVTGLVDGDRVVVSALSLPIDGMPVNIEGTATAVGEE